MLLRDAQRYPHFHPKQPASAPPAIKATNCVPSDTIKSAAAGTIQYYWRRGHGVGCAAWLNLVAGAGLIPSSPLSPTNVSALSLSLGSLPASTTWRTFSQKACLALANVSFGNEFVALRLLEAGADRAICDLVRDSDKTRHSDVMEAVRMGDATVAVV